MNTSTQPTPKRLGAKKLLLIVAISTLAGCATVTHPDPDDPWESYNRSMFQFNEQVDKVFMKPVAQMYEQLTPQPARNCISNIFANLRDLWSSFNSFLQGRGHDGMNSFGRVLFNSTMGLGGCIDVASTQGSKRIPNDFGVTLGVWGVGSGPYFVLPFIGPSTVRDGGAMLGTFAADLSPLTPVFAIDNIRLRNTIFGVDAVSLRANLLSADDLVDRIALDRYSFIRDAYLQRRNALIQGKPVDADSPYTSDTLPDYEDDL